MKADTTFRPEPEAPSRISHRDCTRTALAVPPIIPPGDRDRILAAGFPDDDIPRSVAVLGLFPVNPRFPFGVITGHDLGIASRGIYSDRRLSDDYSRHGCTYVSVLSTLTDAEAAQIASAAQATVQSHLDPWSQAVPFCTIVKVEPSDGSYLDAIDRALSLAWNRHVECAN
jgi:hypothetical protein